jgi:prepilin-type N-terminal cleavage/methylation domain-containing protein
MKSKYSRDYRRRSVRRGFSLVELLTVVAIIVLLIGILVPAVNAVRRNARNTATKATISTLSTGLETFRADQQIGGAYPPSAPDSVGATGSRLRPYEVSNPYAGGTYGAGARYVGITGAGLLVWSLAGADLLGTPGFRTFRSGSRYWSEDTDATGDASSHGAYALDETSREPLTPRYGPYVDLSKVDVTAWNPNATVTGGHAGSFEIPAETEAMEAIGDDPYKRGHPMFLDSFGGPILYWRADPAGFQIADRSPIDDDAQGNMRGIYHFRDNDPLLDSSKRPLVLSAANKPHRLFFEYPAPILPEDIDTQAEIGTNSFAAYIRNKSIEARVSPYKPDSFLLISAGADGIFGTGDDLANFEHNGAELP